MLPGRDRGAGGGQPGRARRWATTTRCSRCPTGSSRGTSSRDRLAAAAAADLVLALYNPASQARPGSSAERASCCWSTAHPTPPVVVGRDVGGPEERSRVTTLGELDPDTVDMRCLC